MSSLIKYLLIVLTLSYSHCKPDPQLNLPPLTVQGNARPDIYPNSYTPNRLTTPADGRDNSDQDRSVRFGPPYGSLGDSEDDRPNDYRQGSMLDDRSRYGFNNFNRGPFNNSLNNFSPQSPFSKDFTSQSDRFNSDPRYNQDRPPYSTTDRFNSDPRYNQNRPPYSTTDRFNSDPRYNQDTFTTGRPPFSTTDRFNNPDNRFEQNDRFNPNNPYNPVNPFDPPQDGGDVFVDDRKRFEQEQQQDRRFAIEMEKLRNFLVESDNSGSTECTANVAAQWNFETDVNELTQTEAVSCAFM